MKQHRSLRLRGERLADLTPAQLATAVAAAYAGPTTAATCNRLVCLIVEIQVPQRTDRCTGVTD